jgi:hypothetical protein
MPVSPVPFRIVFSRAVADQLSAVARQAGGHGMRQQVLADARLIESALRWIADEFGESRWPVGEMGELRFGQIGRVTVWYAVHIGRREVTIARFGFVRPRA